MITNTTRDNYMSANVNTPITETDILAYYVWIPRYKYRLFNTGFASITARSIEIEFETTSVEASDGTCDGEYLVPTDNCWYTHPSFTFGDKDLEGIWVGKYEVSSDTTCTAANYSAVNFGCNNRDYKPRILPGVTSWRGAMPSTFYLAAKKIEADTTYLTTAGKNNIDSHMMKNIEWGAVAYLSYSTYGKNSEVTINNNGETYYTGGGSGDTYKTSLDQSTTGNIYGIYDMSGNAFEYVMGVQKDNVSNKPMSGYANTGNYINWHSGFNGKLFDGTNWSNYTGGINFPDSKYYDLYDYGTTYNDHAAYNRSHIGDALGETRDWNSDTPTFITSFTPWLVRGGLYSSSDYAGLFSFDNGFGYTSTLCSARLILTNVG